MINNLVVEEDEVEYILNFFDCFLKIFSFFFFSDKTDEDDKEWVWIQLGYEFEWKSWKIQIQYCLAFIALKYLSLMKFG